MASSTTDKAAAKKTNGAATPATSKKRRRGPSVSEAAAQPADDSHKAEEVPGEDPEEKPVPLDPQGETKITALGELLGGRRFRFSAFQLPTRHPGRFYALSMDVVRFSSARDTYILFQKNPQMVRLILTDEEKFRLIDEGVVPKNFRSRTIPFITARSAFIRYGHSLIEKGKPVVDDYYEAEAQREKAEHDAERAAAGGSGGLRESSPMSPSTTGTSDVRRRSHTPRRSSPHGGPPGLPPSDDAQSSLTDPNTFWSASPPPVGPVLMSPSVSQQHLPGGSSATNGGRRHTPSEPPTKKATPTTTTQGPSGSGGTAEPRDGGEDETKSTPVDTAAIEAEELAARFAPHADRDAWLFNACQSVWEYNTRLRMDRRKKPKFWDPHTYVHQVPAASQPTRVVAVRESGGPAAAAASTALPPPIVFVPAPDMDGLLLSHGLGHNHSLPQEKPPAASRVTYTYSSGLARPDSAVAASPELSPLPLAASSYASSTPLLSNPAAAAPGYDEFPLAVMPSQYQGYVSTLRTRFNQPLPFHPQLGVDRAALKSQVLAQAAAQMAALANKPTPIPASTPAPARNIKSLTVSQPHLASAPSPLPSASVAGPLTARSTDGLRSPLAHTLSSSVAAGLTSPNARMSPKTLSFS